MRKADARDSQGMSRQNPFSKPRQIPQSTVGSLHSSLGARSSCAAAPSFLPLPDRAHFPFG